jgi:hypothetical protein
MCASQNISFAAAPFIVLTIQMASSFIDSNLIILCHVPLNGDHSTTPNPSLSRRGTMSPP